MSKPMNIGLKREDLFVWLVFKDQEFTNQFREQLSRGDFKYISEYPESLKKDF